MGISLSTTMYFFRHSVRDQSLSVLLLGITLLTGCDSGGLPTVPVSGQFTYGGGDWPAPGYVTFVPSSVDEGLPMRPGTGRFRADGKFVVRSFREGDGLLPGTYDVQIKCWTGQPDGSDPKSFERLNAVPKDFTADELVVEKGGEAIELKIDVPKKE